MGDLEKKIKDENATIKNNNKKLAQKVAVRKVLSVKNSAVEGIENFIRDKKGIIQEKINERNKQQAFQKKWEENYQKYLSKYQESLIGYRGKEVGKDGMSVVAEIHTDMGPLFHTRQLKNVGDHHYESEINSYEGFLNIPATQMYQYVYCTAFRRGMRGDGDCCITYQTIIRDKNGKFSSTVSQYQPNVQIKNQINQEDEIFKQFQLKFHIENYSSKCLEEI